MKNQYRYFIVGKYIIRMEAWKVKVHDGRYAIYYETEKALFDRASKYGYTAIIL